MAVVVAGWRCRCNAKFPFHFHSLYFLFFISQKKNHRIEGVTVVAVSGGMMVGVVAAVVRVVDVKTKNRNRKNYIFDGDVVL